MFKIITGLAALAGLTLSGVVALPGVAMAADNFYTFKDQAVKVCVENALKEANPQRAADAKVTKEEMASLEFLECKNKGIASLEDLEAATKLSTLKIENGQDLKSFAPLNNMPSLKLMNVFKLKEAVSDLTPLKKLEHFTIRYYDEAHGGRFVFEPITGIDGKPVDFGVDPKVAEKLGQNAYALKNTKEIKSYDCALGFTYDAGKLICVDVKNVTSEFGAGGGAVVTHDDLAAKYKGSVTVNKVSVSDVGAHSAQIDLDYNIADKFRGEIAYVTPIILMTHIVNLHVTGPVGEDNYMFERHGGVDDRELTQSSYQRIYGINHYEGEGFNADGASFYRYISEGIDAKKNHETFGIIGLQPGTVYKNSVPQLQPFTDVFPSYGDVIRAWENGKSKVGTYKNLNLTFMRAGILITFKDGTTYMDTKSIPSFKTGVEPKPLPESQLDPKLEGEIQPDGTPAAGHLFRIYVKDLTEECKAKAAEGGCFWYSYIYSMPYKLEGYNHTPFVTILKDKNNRYYFDVNIPSDKIGAHKIALYRADGTLHGWSKVIVKKDATSKGSSLAKTGSTTTTLLMLSLLLIAVGGSAVGLRRRFQS